MSVLEIILYSLLGVGTLIYITIAIVKKVRKKKGKEKQNDLEL